MVTIKSEEWIIYKGTVGKFASNYDVFEDLHEKENQDKVAKYILKLMKHENMIVDFKLSLLDDYTVFTLMKEYSHKNRMTVIFFGGNPGSSFSPTGYDKTDINLKNIKAVLRKATEIMFGTVNA